MTSTQAKTAVTEGTDFLLCVVPVTGGTSDLTLDTVRKSIKFVVGIGSRVAPLCDDLDDLEKKRETVTANAPQGVRLEVQSGVARILVAASVWQNDGFSLAELADRLK